MSRAAEREFPGVRLLQAAYHPRSLSLYAKRGLQVRDLLATMQGDAIGETVPGHSVRVAEEGDIESCNRVCAAAHRYDRAGELRDAVAQGSAHGVERDGEIVGYTTGVAFSATRAPRRTRRLRGAARFALPKSATGARQRPTGRCVPVEKQESVG